MGAWQTAQGSLALTGVPSLHGARSDYCGQAVIAAMGGKRSGGAKVAR